MTDTLDFTGRTVIVTGVGRAGQIGNAVALSFGRAGAKIVACDLNAGGVATIGRALFTDYLYPFEVTSVLLLVALVGVIALAKRRVA